MKCIQGAMVWCSVDGITESNKSLCYKSYNTHGASGVCGRCAPTLAVEVCYPNMIKNVAD